MHQICRQGSRDVDLQYDTRVGEETHSDVHKYSRGTAEI